MARLPSQPPAPRGGKPARRVMASARAEKQAIDDALHYAGFGALPAPPTSATPDDPADEPAHRARPARSRRR